MLPLPITSIPFRSIVHLHVHDYPCPVVDTEQRFSSAFQRRDSYDAASMVIGFWKARQANRLLLARIKRIFIFKQNTSRVLHVWPFMVVR